MRLELKTDLTCSTCLKPINDIEKAHVLWISHKSGYPMLTAVHGGTCDAPDLFSRYRSWEKLEDFLKRQDEFRIYINSKIFQKVFTHKDVKDGLERIFATIPDRYFEISDNDLRQWYEKNNW